jgi:RNA polymerase sigma-B factor
MLEGCEGFCFLREVARDQGMTQQEIDTHAANRLWADYSRTHDPRVREALIQQFERLAYSIANRFAQRGTEAEDLYQVARIGLVKAVDRFDPLTNYRFSTFATPTILGEIKRYFRDNSRAVHVPRGVQEMERSVGRASRELVRRLGRPPTPQEIATELGVAEERVLEALAVQDATHPLSLDGEMEAKEGGDRPSVLEQCLGTEDTGLERTEFHVCVRQLLRHLSEPLQHILQLRYLAELSQREVGRRLGLSQMQVSRMEKRALGELRSHIAIH